MSKKIRKALDLEPLVNTVADARALVNVAYQVVMQGQDVHGESVVLRLAVKALDRIGEQLDDADNQLSRFRKASR